MIAEIGSLITSSKAAYDIAKGISSLKSEVDRNESISKILEVLLAVQTNALSVNAIAQKLQEDKRELTQKIVEFEKWSETEAQYELKEISVGVFVYSYKITDKPSEPIHWLCAKCYNEKKKSIFQFDRASGVGSHYICHNCKSEITVHNKEYLSSCREDFGPRSGGDPNSWMAR